MVKYNMIREEFYKLRSANNQFEKITISDITENTEVRFAGYETGKLLVVYINENKVIIREQGQNRWCSRGETAYDPPKYLIGIIKDSNFFKVYEIEYNKQTAKQAKQEALNLVQGKEIKRG
jgi:hypothetical protein